MSAFPAHGRPGRCCPDVSGDFLSFCEHALFRVTRTERSFSGSNPSCLPPALIKTEFSHVRVALWGAGHSEHLSPVSVVNSGWPGWEAQWVSSTQNSLLSPRGFRVRGGVHLCRSQSCPPFVHPTHRGHLFPRKHTEQTSTALPVVFDRKGWTCVC